MFPDAELVDCGFLPDCDFVPSAAHAGLELLHDLGVLDRRLILSVDVQSRYFLLLLILAHHNDLLVVVVKQRHLLLLQHRLDLRLDVSVLLQQFGFERLMKAVVVLQAAVLLAQMPASFLEVHQPTRDFGVDVVPGFQVHSCIQINNRTNSSKVANFEIFEKRQKLGISLEH